MFKILSFAGKAPKISPRLLPEDMAQTASNARLDNGQLRSWKAAASTATSVPAGTSTIYKLTDSIWLTFQDEVDVVGSQVAEDKYNRYYWTGNVYPRYGSYTAVTTGGPPYPGTSYRLGLPRPSKPTVVIGGTPDEGATAQNVAYTLTYVTEYGEESPPALLDNSDVKTWTPGETRTITFPSVPTGAYPLTGAKWRVYRTNINGEFQFVAEYAFGTANFVDTLEDSLLGEIVPSTYWEAPPDEVTADHPDGQLLGLTALPNGFLAGYSGKTLAFSEAYLPHAWPTSYQLATQWNIVALASTSVGLVVATEGKPYIVQGTDPQSVSMQEIDSNQSCVSKRSMVDMGDYCIYASPDGLVAVSEGGVEVITEKLFTRDQWQALVPTTIHAYSHDGKYIGFYNDGQSGKGFIFDPRNENAVWTDLSFYADAGFSDLKTDKLYLLIGTTIYEFDGGSALTYTWKSKQFYYARPLCPAAAKVDAETYPVTFKLYTDGVLKHTETVQNTKPFRLPGGYMSREFEVELSGTTDVNGVWVSVSMSEIDQ